MKMETTKETTLSVMGTVHFRRELVNIRHELAEKELEIVRLKAVKSQFVRRVAHDLRNPLCVILSFSDFLYDETKDVLTDVQKDFLKRIKNSTNYMLKQIADLIDISTMDFGNLAIKADILDIVSLAAENINQKRKLAAQKNITINFEISDPIVYVYADEYRIEQVFNILLLNAIMFSDQGSVIAVKISKEIDTVSIRVADSGMGIAAKNLDKIFVPSTKVAVRGIRGDKGTGLGLAIVKQISEEHKGKIKVESEIGKGSSFIVTLPLK